jgi:small-conductance mechanosensitive channel
LDLDYRSWLLWGAGLLAALVVALLAHGVAYAVAGRAAARTRSVVDDAVVARSRGPARLIFLLIAGLAVLPGLPEAGRPAAEVVNRLLTLAMTGSVGWLAVSLTGVVQDYVEARFDIGQADNLLARQAYTRTRVLRRIAAVIIGIVTVCLMLMAFPSIRQIGVSLFASAGLAGLVVGLAARPVLENLIAGLQMALTQPIRIEDVVIVEGEWGWIEEITSTYVVVRIWDLRRLIVPLSYFITTPFQNWTRRTADILGTVHLYADYTVPVPEVRAALYRILEESELWDGKVRGLQVTDAKPETVELRALMSAPSSGRAWDLRCHVREELLAWLQQAHPEALPRVRVELDRQAARPGEPSAAGSGAGRLDDRGRSPT